MGLFITKVDRMRKGDLKNIFLKTENRKPTELPTALKIRRRRGE